MEQEVRPTPGRTSNAEFLNVGPNIRGALSHGAAGRSELGRRSQWRNRSGYRRSACPFATVHQTIARGEKDRLRLIAVDCAHFPADKPCAGSGRRGRRMGDTKVSGGGSPTWIPNSTQAAMQAIALHRGRDRKNQLPNDRFTVSAMRSGVGSTASSRLSAAGSGICGVVIRTGGPSRS
jgi:hypothetical protein